jgi:hypothetical protein
MPYGLWSVLLVASCELVLLLKSSRPCRLRGFQVAPKHKPDRRGGGQKGDSSSPRNKSQKRCTLKKSGGFMMKAEERLMMCVSCELTE